MCRKNVVLIGFMGTGKSRVGQMISRKLGMKFVDTDDLIVERAQMSIPDIFAKFGEPRFREIEEQVVADVAKRESQVIATGGGVPLCSANMENLKKNGVVICLVASPETIYRRTLYGGDRPLLDAADKLEQIRSLLESRETYYDAADFQVETSGRPASAVAREIVDIYGANGSS